MKKLILFTILILNSTIGLSQKDSTKKHIFEDYHLYPSIGISYQKQLVGEVGVLYAYSQPFSHCQTNVLYGIKLAAEFNFNSNHFYMAPKIGIQTDYLLLSARLNLIDYTNSTYHDLKLTPEIGLSITNIINIYYGYNIPLTPNKINDIGTHRVTLNFNFGIWSY